MIKKFNQMMASARVRIWATSLISSSGQTAPKWSNAATRLARARLVLTLKIARFRTYLEKNVWRLLKLFKKRNICECDKKLAEQLSFHESEWDETKHAVRGGFKREENCIKKKSPFKFQECCGDRFTFPFNKPRKDNQCCEGPQAKPDGTCSN